MIGTEKLGEVAYRTAVYLGALKTLAIKQFWSI